MTKPLVESRLCDLCRQVTSAPTGDWRTVPDKTAGGLSVIGYQQKYQCADLDCGAVEWVSTGRKRPTEA